VTDQLLSTKLFIPSKRPHQIHRSQLISLLNEGLERRLTLISAPPGFGKTMLLASWVKECGLPAAWISLDEGDNDIIRLLSYLLTALQTVQPGLGDDALQVLQTPQLPIQQVLVATINEITSERTEPFIVVLDDYHVIENHEVHAMLAYLIDHMPPQMHLYLASRTNPPLPFSRLRARDQLVEIRTKDLRFSTTETDQLLNHALGFNLSSDIITALANRTEGWAAGLHMTAASLRGRPNPEQFIRQFTGSNQYIFDYLLEEVLHNQPQDIQDFLLFTSILNRLCSPLCDLLTGQDNSQAILEWMEQTNLFITPLDETHTWFRYHQLFAEILRKRLQQTQPHLFMQLHQKASRWMLDNNFWLEAYRLAVLAQDLGLTIEIIEKASQDLMERGHITTLHAWIERLPVERVYANARLCISYAWCCLIIKDSSQAAIQYLQQAEQLVNDLKIDADAKNSLLGRICGIRSIAYIYTGDFVKSAEIANQAQRYISENDAFALNVIAWAQFFSGFITSGIEPNTQTLLKHVETKRNISNNFLAVMSLYAVGMVRVYTGNLRQADQILRKGLSLYSDSDSLEETFEKDFSLNNLLYFGLSELARERNQLLQALQYSEKAQALYEKWENSELLVDLYNAKARIYQNLGKSSEANRIINKSLSICNAGKVVSVTFCMTRLIYTRILILQGNLPSAWEQIHQIDTLRKQHLIGESLSHMLVKGMGTNIHAWLLILDGRYQEAADMLEAILEEMKASKWLLLVLESYALLAISHHRLNRRQSACHWLNLALTQAEPEGILRTFLDLGNLFQSVLLAYRADFIHDARLSTFIDSLLDAFARETTTAQVNQNHEQPPKNLLSDREMEVLTLLAAGHTNPQIATRLVLGTSTVKTHTLNIYRKLGVSNRTQALVRAKELGVIK